MKLQNLLNRLEKLHPKEIDLSLERIKKLCKKLDNPQKKLNCISIVGTNGKYSTIQAFRSILKSANINCNIYTSPHIKKINERFIYNNQQISDEELIKLLDKIEQVNNGEEITFYEILTAAYFYRAKKFPNNINLIEAGLFHRFDATNILDKNIASIITAIGLDHLDWLPKRKKNIDQIIFEKTSSLLNSKIIISNQHNKEILNKIRNSLKNNKSKKIFFNSSFTYSINENNFFYYEDEFGGLKLPMPNVEGEFQLSNIASAIATLRNIKEIKISDKNIKEGITNIKSIARLQEIKSGKIKKFVKNNKLYIDGSHNALGAEMLVNHLEKKDCRKHIILGMMKNKDHINYIKFFKNKISTLTIIDIPNQKNSIKGTDLLKKINSFKNIKYKKTIHEALMGLELEENDIVLITGSLYLAGEVLKLN